MSDSPPKGIFSRSRKILGVSLKIASQEASRITRNKLKTLDKTAQLAVRIKQARELVKTLGELKGAAMKIGQILSIDSSDWLPPEVVAVLSELQNSPPPVDTQKMFELVIKELGQEKFNALNLEPTPLAGASIGQVYKGQLDGKPIVCKVQYPGIKESVKSDLKLIKPIVSNFSKIIGKKIDYQSTFDEIQRVLLMETDYRKEAKSLSRYAENFSSHEQFSCPDLVADYSTTRVLTQSFIEGIPLKQWIDSSPSNEEREEVARKLLLLFQLEFFKYRFVQTDPNPANFLIQKNLTIGIIDLGATLKYTKKFINHYKELVSVVLTNDEQIIRDFFLNSDYIDSRESEECLNAFASMQKIGVRPFLKENQPFDFKDDQFNKDIKLASFKFFQKLKYSSVPNELIFLQRKLGGIFLLLKQLEVQIDITNFFDDIPTMQKD